MARINPPSDVGYDSDSLDVGNDIGSCIEQIKVEESNYLGDGTVPASSRGTVISVRQQRRQMAAAERKASVLSRGDDSEQLYTLVNEVTGEIDGEVGLATLRSFLWLFES